MKVIVTQLGTHFICHSSNVELQMQNEVPC